MTNGRIPIITDYAVTDLVHLKVNPYSGDPRSQATPVSNFFGNINTPVGLRDDGLVTNGLWIDAGGIKSPGLKPATEVAHGLLDTPAWAFGDEALEANEESVSFSIRIPTRMDRTVAPSMAIGWSADAISPGVCEWALEYRWSAPGEDTGAAAQETLYTHDTAPATADGLVMSQFVGIDVPSALDVCIHCKLKRLSSASAGSSADTIAIDVHLHGVCLVFTSDKLGAPA